jgi:hypothetical protein
MTDALPRPSVELWGGAQLRIRNSLNADYADFYHDGTDFNTDFTNTADWNIDGLTNVDFLDGTKIRLFASGSSSAQTFQAVAGNIIKCVPLSFFDVGSTTPGETTKAIRSFFNGSNGAPYYAFNGTSIDDQQWQFCFNFDGNVNNKRHAIRSKHNGSVAADNSIDFLFHDAAGADGDLPSIFSFRIGATATSVRAGTSFFILDSTNADSIKMDHDGTDFNAAFTGTTDWNITGLTGVILPDCNIEGLNANGPAFINEAASGTNPTLAPDKSDDDTGIGTAGADILSLVAGAHEAVRYTEVSDDVIAQVSANVGLTADVGSAQGNGVITSTHNIYSTVATTGDAATLPSTFGIGTVIYVKNDGANSMDVFPASGDDAGAGTDTAVAVAAGDFAVFMGTVADTTWTKIMGGTA